MKTSEVIRIAFSNVKNNLLRSILTLLIIAFGLMALVGILTAIDSIIYSMNDNFSRLGANSFSIQPSGYSGGRVHSRGKTKKQGAVITFDQANQLKKKYTYPATVSISLFGTQIATVTHDDKKSNPNIVVKGVDENYLNVQGYNLEYGRNFSINEINSSSPKAIIGIDIAKKMFGKNYKKGINNSISVSNRKYKVIGILASKGSSATSNDNVVFIPITNAKNIYGTARRNYNINIQVENVEDLSSAIGSAIGTFRNVRSLRIGQDNDFEIRKSDGIAKMLKENTAQIQIGAISIGLITLFGAAIGLMNIMLVSVTERTREIGIIKALGATRKNILIQFMTEAVILCQAGGILGIILGILIGVALSIGLGGSFHMPWAWSFLGIALSLGVGLISGIYPALKASKLDPIEALRYE